MSDELQVKIVLIAFFIPALWGLYQVIAMEW